MTDRIVLRSVPVIRVVRLGGGGASGGGAWGTITGTLSDQTDLQSALDAKQAVDGELTAIAGLTSAADRLPYFTGSGTAALATFTAFGRSLVDDADASAARTTLGLGTAATANTGDFDPAGAAAAAQAASQPLDGDLTAIAALSATGGWAKRTAANTWEISTPTAADVGADPAGSAAAAQAASQPLDADLTAIAALSGTGGWAKRTAANTWTISTPTASDVGADPAGSAAAAQAASQPVDAELTALAGLTSAADALPYFTGAGTAGTTTLTAFIRTLLDDVDAAAARTTLGAGTGSGDALTTNPLSQFAATTSAQLRGVLSDETGTGAAVFQGGDIGAATGTSLDVTGGKLSSTQAVGATSTDGSVLATSSTAAAGAQKYSPRMRFKGSGWKTNATAGAQDCEWTAEVQPEQGSANPVAKLVFSHSVNGGAFAPKWIIDGDRGASNNSFGLFPAAASSVGLIPYTNTDLIVGNTVSSMWRFTPYTSNLTGHNDTCFVMNSAGAIGWTDAGNATNWVDTVLTRGGARVIRMGTAPVNPPRAYSLAAESASGTNTAGAGPTKFIASLATGNAASGGYEWHTGDPGASGTTLQTATKKMGLDGTGLFDLVNTTEATSSTAGAFKTAGGGAFAKKIIAGGQIRPGTFTVATLPAGTAGDMAYATDGRKVGEGAGVGTGTHVLYSNGQWRLPEDQSVVAA